MFIPAFCKFCELGTEREIVFVMISIDSQGDINTGVISGSHMGSQLLQNTEIIKQTDVLIWKIWRKYRSVLYLFSCNLPQLRIAMGLKLTRTSPHVPIQSGGPAVMNSGKFN